MLGKEGKSGPAAAAERLTYDYIIIGAGSAGCVLANRLSADARFQILLIEQGQPNTSLIVTMPKGFGKLLFDAKNVTRFATQAEAGSGDQPESWPTGAMVGGSSAINGMFYTRGHPQDYDDWAAAGLTNWSWSQIKQSFTAMEDHALGATTHRGEGGPLHVSVNPMRNPLCEATIQAGVQIGLTAKQDINDETQDGIGYAPLTIKSGRRVSAATAFLDPVRQRRNLTILTGTKVRRIEFDHQRADAVICTNAAGAVTYKARREIIVSAGTLQSPKILQLSGIGPAALLSRFGIPVVADLSEVGCNLREHRMLVMQFRVLGTDSINGQFEGRRLVTNLARYLVTRRGHMATGSHDVIAFLRSTQKERRPDIEIVMAPFSIDFTAKTLAFERAPGLQFFGYQLRPESRGSVFITSPNPDIPPEIRPSYLTAEIDRTMSSAIMAKIRLLAQAPALRKHLDGEVLPGSAVATDQQALAYHQRFGAPVNHMSGTCRLGSDMNSVLDARARVRGVDGLRVVDCSMMPSLVSGHTNGPVMAMAWRAADLIIQDAAE